MTHYVAIVEDAGPDVAVGIWFPDLPGCFSAGDTVDEALQNAPEAIAAYAEALADNGRSLPAPRRLSEIKSDPVSSADLDHFLVALVESPVDQ
ncbi:MAG: type II toxin-antitoxin system HicB family antitoxin [Bauldia sp.]|nr:type II toxin-antitoxin system HicB family antitoxin [Bauldia sp.]